MKLAIMQPYFFPYLGYFSLINLSERFILFDTVQSIRRGWIERNRILKPNGEFLYIKVPLEKYSRKTLIKELKIRNERWREKILAQLVPYKKNAPFYQPTLDLINESWNIETDSIVQLNENVLKTVCSYIGIQTPIEVWSAMNIKIDNVNEPDEWALEICKRMNANTYYNPIKGIEFFKPKKYTDQKVDIYFLESVPKSYKQFGNKYIANLSIIDVLMFNSINQIKLMLNSYELYA